MAKLTGRRKREVELAAAILLMFSRHDPEDFDEDDFSADLAGVMMPFLRDTYRESATRTLGNAGLAVDHDAIGSAADSWSEHYSNTVSGDVGKTTGTWLGEDRAGVFDPSRAETIAITEITRADTAGMLEHMDEIEEAMGQGLEVVWVCVLDDLLCQACAELDGLTWDEFSPVAPAGPPLHPNCRCTISSEAQ